MSPKSKFIEALHKSKAIKNQIVSFKTGSDSNKVNAIFGGINFEYAATNANITWLERLGTEYWRFPVSGFDYK